MKQQRRRNFQTHLADEFPFISFLILWLIRPCWFIDRSGCTVYDDVLRSRFSFPDFFFHFPLHLFLLSPSIVFFHTISLAMFLPEKMHKESSFQSRRMHRKYDKRPWSRMKNSVQLCRKPEQTDGKIHVRQSIVLSKISRNMDLFMKIEIDRPWMFMYIHVFMNIAK